MEECRKFIAFYQPDFMILSTKTAQLIFKEIMLNEEDKIAKYMGVTVLFDNSADLGEVTFARKV